MMPNPAFERTAARALRLPEVPSLRSGAGSHKLRGSTGCSVGSPLIKGDFLLSTARARLA